MFTALNRLVKAAHYNTQFIYFFFFVIDFN